MFTVKKFVHGEKDLATQLPKPVHELLRDKPYSGFY